MNNKNMPSNNDLPSKGKLIRSTIVAIGIAIIILVTAVLPAYANFRMLPVQTNHHIPNLMIYLLLFIQWLKSGLIKNILLY